MDNRIAIDLTVEKLLDEETIDGDEFRKILSKFTILPLKNKSSVPLLARV